MLETWRTHRGMTLRAKLVTLTLVWLMLGSAALFLAESLFMKLVLIGIASVKTVVLARIRTVAAEG